MSDLEKARWRGAVGILLVCGAITTIIMGLPGWGWFLFVAILVMADL